jgi:triacylglycerol lipase
VHGLLGFDRIAIGSARSDYFRGIRAHLEALGNEVYVVRLPPAAGVRRRAERLVEQVERLPRQRLNLVAHSLGGLDARYAISRLGLASRVASLTTIGTPHHGTPLADGFGPLLARIGIEGARDASVRRMSRFNREVIDAPGVEYLSVVAVADTLLWRVAFPGIPSDGLVPAQSQSWGRVVSEVRADHWAQIGWSRRFDAVDFYERLLIELSSRGH